MACVTSGRTVRTGGLVQPGQWAATKVRLRAMQCASAGSAHWPNVCTYPVMPITGRRVCGTLELAPLRWAAAWPASTDADVPGRNPPVRTPPVAKCSCVHAGRYTQIYRMQFEPDKIQSPAVAAPCLRTTVLHWIHARQRQTAMSVAATDATVQVGRSAQVPQGSSHPTVPAGGLLKGCQHGLSYGNLSSGHV